MRTNILQVVKAVLAAVLVSLVLVLIFTVLIQLFSIPLTAVKPVNSFHSYGRVVVYTR